MSTERITDDTLDALFAEARAAAPAVPEALMARVLADAAAAQPRAIAAPRPRVGLLAGLFAALGGRGAAAGLAAAGLAGVWIGLVQPVDLTFQGFTAASAETLDLYPADLDALSEVLAPELTPEG